MQSLFDANEMAAILCNIRSGDILMPDQLQAELRNLDNRPPLGSYALTASVPSWLIDKIDTVKQFATDFTAYPSLDRRDTLLLATLQCNGAQLRCVMSMSDPKVKLFLSDVVGQGVFTLLCGIENTKQYVVLTLPLKLDDPQDVLSQIKSATVSETGLAPAVQLAVLTTSPQFQPSLIAGQDVNDVIVILAGVPSPTDIKTAFNFDVELQERVDRAPLH